MGLFNNLMSKIFGHAAPTAAAKGPQTAAAALTTSFGRADRAELASAAERACVAGMNDTDFVGLVCASKESPSP
jgi:hypothetical protein